MTHNMKRNNNINHGHGIPMTKNILKRVCTHIVVVQMSLSGLDVTAVAIVGREYD